MTRRFDNVKTFSFLQSSNDTKNLILSLRSYDLFYFTSLLCPLHGRRIIDNAFDCSFESEDTKKVEIERVQRSSKYKQNTQ